MTWRDVGVDLHVAVAARSGGRSRASKSFADSDCRFGLPALVTSLNPVQLTEVSEAPGSAAIGDAGELELRRGCAVGAAVRDLDDVVVGWAGTAAWRADRTSCVR